METKNKLVMTFVTVGEKKVSISLDDPKDNITKAEIKSAMDLIISKDIFSINGEALKALVDAKVVNTDTTKFEVAK